VDEELKVNGLSEKLFKPSDTASASLDVVFEQSEDRKSSISNEDFLDEKLFSIGNENIPISLTRSSPALTHLRQVW